MLVVHDVEAASAWFQDALGLRSGHGGDEYEMLLDGDELVLQLHCWDVHEHAYLGDVHDPSRGNGVAVWFSTDDFDGLLARIDGGAVDVVDGPLFNSNAQHHEVWLRGPDGFLVVVSGPRLGSS